MSLPVLVLLPHQDDEVFLYPTLRRLVNVGVPVQIIYLTNGEFHGDSSETRNRESIAALANLNINKNQIYFLGSESNIDDGQLAHNLEQVWNILQSRLSSEYSDIFAPAFEGGNHDHDACAILAKQLASRYCRHKKSRHFFMYTGNGAFGPLYRVYKPTMLDNNSEFYKLSMGDIADTLKAMFYFKSQIKTWLGLFPEFFIRLVLIRREVIFVADSDFSLQYRSRPLYSRWGRMQETEFFDAVKQFLAKLSTS